MFIAIRVKPPFPGSSFNKAYGYSDRAREAGKLLLYWRHQCYSNVRRMLRHLTLEPEYVSFPQVVTYIHDLRTFSDKQKMIMDGILIIVFLIV